MSQAPGLRTEDYIDYPTEVESSITAASSIMHELDNEVQRLVSANRFDFMKEYANEKKKPAECHGVIFNISMSVGRLGKNSFWNPRCVF